MIESNGWLTTVSERDLSIFPSLSRKIKSDVCVIGGGMAGLHAALVAHEAGAKVVLLEGDFCGSGAAGKSAGFLTPESELDFLQVQERFGTRADIVRDIPKLGVEMIVNTAKKFRFKCDLRKEDSLYCGIGRSGEKQVREEYASWEGRSEKVRLYEPPELKKVIGADSYRVALRYGGTYGFNPFLYTLSLKRLLKRQGVRIYERSEVMRIVGHQVVTREGMVLTDNMIIATDGQSLLPHTFVGAIDLAHTFLCLSKPLSDRQVKEIFPAEPLLCWDSRLIYTYYRLTNDRRLLLGGGSLWSTFSRWKFNEKRVIDKIIRRWHSAFPGVDLDFDYYWSGYVPAMDDLIPVVDRDERRPHITYIAGATGLPWAAYCGSYAAQVSLGLAIVPGVEQVLGAARRAGFYNKQLPAPLRFFLTSHFGTTKE